MNATKLHRRVVIFLGLSAFLATFLMCGTSASAWMIVLGGNTQQLEQENVLLNRSAGPLVFGRTNQTNALVEFSSTGGDLMVAGSNGQSFISGKDDGKGGKGGTMLDISITLADGGAFTGLVLGLNLPGVGHSSGCTDCIHYAVAGTAAGSGNLPGRIGPGTAFFTFLAPAGQMMSGITLSGVESQRLADIRQVRIGGIGETFPTVAENGTVATPEGTTFLLLGCGLTILGVNKRHARTTD